MNSSPNEPSSGEPGSQVSAKKNPGRWLAIIGVALFTGPIWGAIGTVIGMTRAFNTLAENAGAPSGKLSHDISIAVVSMMIGLSIGLIGAVLIFTALFAMKNRESWFFHGSFALAIIWCVAVFPYGLVVGLPVVISFIVMREEFRKQDASP